MPDDAKCSSALQRAGWLMGLVRETGGVKRGLSRLDAWSVLVPWLLA